MGGTSSLPDVQLSPERTYVVTGANTGIGFVTAKRIAQFGGRVIVACRSEQKAKDAIERMRVEILEECSKSGVDAPDLDIRYMHLDLSSLDSVESFAREYRESGLPLHVLICNAGLTESTKKLTGDGFETMFQVNYLSHFLLTLLLLPVIKESAPNSRIVNVSSGGHKMSSWKVDDLQGKKSFSRTYGYGNTKLYQVMNMYYLSRVMSGSNISVFSLHPGIVSTDFARDSNALMKSLISLGKSPESGARTSLIAALDPVYDGKTALYFSDGKPCSSSDSSRDEVKQKQLWTYSLQCLRGRLNDVILEGVGEKLENIKPLEE